MPEHVVERGSRPSLFAHRQKSAHRNHDAARATARGEDRPPSLHQECATGKRCIIADVVKQMRADGITSAAAICLITGDSRTSVGLYRRAAFAEAGDELQLGTLKLGRASSASGGLRRQAHSAAQPAL